jgi:predicted ArsR family transcriptional regulator
MTRLDAIADPVRLAIVRFLGSRAASAKEIADGIGVHLNTARAHLRALVEAGVVRKAKEPRRGRGRPVVRYRIKAGWRPAGDDLLGLAQLMGTAVGRGAAQGRARARRWGRAAANAGTGTARTDLERMLSGLGFAAAVGDDELRLSGCPCPLVSPDRPASICGLVDAAIDGALERGELTAGARHHDPAGRRCCIALAPA